MSLAGLAGFAEGFAGARQDQKDRAEREANAKRMDAVIAAYQGGGQPIPGAMGAMPDQGGMGQAPSPVGGGNRDEFIAAMMPHALRVAKQTGLDPRLIIAQAAQETGWGKSAPGNNYFGIKSHGKPGGNSLATNEVVNGQTVRINDSFRGYGNMGESADGYASFLQENPRYRGMLSAGNLDGQLDALGKSGYATDPNYANSVGSIARSIPLPGDYGPQQTGQAGIPNTSATKRAKVRAEWPAFRGVSDAAIDAAIAQAESGGGVMQPRPMGATGPF